MLSAFCFDSSLIVSITTLLFGVSPTVNKKIIQTSEYILNIYIYIKQIDFCPRWSSDVIPRSGRFVRFKIFKSGFKISNQFTLLLLVPHALVSF